MFKKPAIYILCVLSCFSFAQLPFRFIWPIDSPRVITGNYGELRPNHFHDGLDFSTGGKVNMPVYAAEEGYVSRIRVSATGYGKSVYITHPNGKVSVYAHLNSFGIKIAGLVKQEQYAKKSFEVELFLKPHQAIIRKREIIGLSGNTGGSTGPHVHFEIRDEKSETPLNPLTFFKIKDSEHPVIQKIGFYNLADTSAPQFIKAFSLKQIGHKLSPQKDTIVLDQAIVGFAFSGFDRCVSNGNPNNIFSAKLYLDAKLIYAHTLNKIDFSDNRYVNEFSETIDRLKFQKCFLPTLYPPNMYGDCFNKGRILLSDSNYHHLKFIATDESGNEREIEFYIKTKHFNYYRSTSVKSDVFVNCNTDFFIRKNDVALLIPAKTLFYSTPVIIENALEASGRLILQLATINFKSAAIIGFKASGKLKENPHQQVLKSGSVVYSPVYRNDSVIYAIKNFGIFQLLRDVNGPIIKPQLNTKKAKKINSQSSVSFIVDDALSGLQSYNLFINDVWVIGEYDAKYNLITYYFDEESPTGVLEFRMEAEDKVGNKSVFNYKLRH